MPFPRFLNFGGLFQAVTNREPEISVTADNWVSPSDIPLIEPFSKELSYATTQDEGGTARRAHCEVPWNDTRKDPHARLDHTRTTRCVLECILLIIHPFYRFVGKDMMTDLSYPLKSNTVPIWSVPVYAMLLPLVIFISIYFRRRDVYDLHHAVLGLLYSVLVTAVLTDSIKNAVGRPRPDFFWRCFPDGKAVYDTLGDVICHVIKVHKGRAQKLPKRTHLLVFCGSRILVAVFIREDSSV
ncbi:hypothetical protein HID58_069174 [Brassica napus]|uniref:Phosphatidic acid phosphatase type 2/haloperoxidase domain-containing protein n=1 Tax=Brassica napus TaxID=3708 RepID=A0ABQ7XHC0_BRANA|nr:hypothetical protein HID58_069174 [Brassica napus]